MKLLPGQSRLAADGHHRGLPEIDLHDGDVLLVGVVLSVHGRENSSSRFQAPAVMSRTRVHVALKTSFTKNFTSKNKKTDSFYMGKLRRCNFGEGRQHSSL